MQTVTSRGSNPTNPTIQHYCLYKSSKEQMNSEQYAAFVEDPDEEWAIDVDTTPLVNISTFGWTEGKPIQIQNLCASFHNMTLLR